MRALPVQLAQVVTSGRGAFGAERTATHTHRGSDFSRPEGTTVYATADGIAQFASAEWEPGFSGYGGHVVLRHAQCWTLSAHLAGVAVVPGERVLAGDPIGAVGRTEFKRDDHGSLLSGAHLHFEVSPARYPQQSEAARLDPAGWLRGAVDPRVAIAISIASRASGVELAMLRALAYAASMWNPAAREGDRLGLFGITEANARLLNLANPIDPVENASAAATLIKALSLRFVGFESIAAAYASPDQGSAATTPDKWPANVAHFVRAARERYALETREAVPLGDAPLLERRAVGRP